MSSSTRKRNWAVAVLLLPMLGLLVFLLLVGITARERSGVHRESGNITLANINLVRNGREIFLDATAKINLPVTIEAGLDSGVPLIFVLTLRLFEPVDYWFDRQLKTIERRFSLTYYELTRHYRVQTLESDASQNYRSLSAALRGLGKVDRLPMLVESADDSSSRSDLSFEFDQGGVVAGLEMKLDSRSLPLPLQSPVIASWRLSSKEVQWSVN